MSEPVHDYTIKHAKFEDGNEDPMVFLITTQKSIGTMVKLPPHKQDLHPEVRVQMLMAMLQGTFHSSIHGIDVFEQVGRYSMRVVVAGTFDPALVKAEVIEKVIELQSDIEVVQKSAIITP